MVSLEHRAMQRDPNSDSAANAGISRESTNRTTPPILKAALSLELQRPQEGDEVLLLLRAQPIEMLDHCVRLAATALVSSDGFYQVARTPIVQEENALSDAPERRAAELVGAGAALRDTVCQRCAHVVDKKVREKIRRLIGKRHARAGGGTARDFWVRGKRWSMTMDATDLRKRGASFFTGRRGGSGSRRRQHAHEVGERLDVREDCREGTAGGGRRREVERVLGSCAKNAARRFVALLLEKLVRDAHLNVVGLAREDQQ